MIKNEKYTIRDIAELSGVSSGTVDRVIHGRGEVSEKTREKILGIVKELGYEPNILARSLALKKIYKIALLLPKSSKANPYWLQPVEGAKKAEKEVKSFGIEVIKYFYDFTDEKTFINEANKLLELKPDGIIFSPFFYNESLEFIDKCEKLGIQYILIDSKIKNANYLSFIGQDPYQSGLLAGKLMCQLVSDDSKVLIITISKKVGNSNNLNYRVKGFTDFIKSAYNKKNISLQNLQIPDSNSPKDIFYGNQFIMPDHVNGIFIPNSRAFLVADYLIKKKLLDIHLIGYDIIKRNVIHLEQGTIDYLIGQLSEDQGYRAVMTFFNYFLLQKEVVKDLYMPINIIARENVRYYLDK
jgi:LacI family transcriptional regulator